MKTNREYRTMELRLAPTESETEEKTEVSDESEE